MYSVGYMYAIKTLYMYINFTHTKYLAILLAKPALALRKLDLSLPGPSARKMWANTLMAECQRCCISSTDQPIVIGPVGQLREKWVFG